MTQRLHVVLARAGIASRRACEELIAAGRVRVNGRVVREQGVRVDPSRDLIEVNGHPIRLQEPKVYILLYKPAGYISTVRDPHGRPTVLDLVPVAKRIYPVGRLDVDSEGLLLLTNDGEITNRLTHPRYEHEKEYLVQVEGVPSRQELRTLREGIELEDGLTSPATVRVVSPTEIRRILPKSADCLPRGTTWLRVIVHEGRKRQIRRMFQAIGHPVRRLIRIRMASLKLGDLRPGKWRYLSPKEITQLRQWTRERSERISRG
ncbi:MAG: rRNA pseudouridine synthase [Anaerolineae bacterium]|nr:rRNA pseudouridine synthase [Anaerolineae bacterium]